MSQGLVEVRGVSKSFPAGDRTIRVLDGVDLRVAAGESVALVGPSGSGKSTLLNLLGTLDTPDQGTIVIDGRDLSTMAADELARFRNQNLGFVFQSHHLLPHLSVLENVLVPVLAHGSRIAPEVVARAEAGGERQRAAVVRALINQPKLVLADEPTGALDRTSAGEVAALLGDLNREQGITLVVVTHSEELASRMNRVLTMQDGRLG